MVLVSSCSNWGLEDFSLNDGIKPAVLFAGNFMCLKVEAVHVPVVVDIQAL